MREIVSGAEVRAEAGIASRESFGRVHTLAVYGALVLIAAIVFGTLSFRPF